VSIVFDMNKRFNIGLRDDVYNKLKDKGRFGESFSELVSRLIDEAKSTTTDGSVRGGFD
jgi:predicted CopG family antitoxin